MRFGWFLGPFDKRITSFQCQGDGNRKRLACRLACSDPHLTETYQLMVQSECVHLSEVMYEPNALWMYEITICDSALTCSDQSSNMVFVLFQFLKGVLKKSWQNASTRMCCTRLIIHRYLSFTTQLLSVLPCPLVTGEEVWSLNFSSVSMCMPRSLSRSVLYKGMPSIV